MLWTIRTLVLRVLVWITKDSWTVGRCDRSDFANADHLSTQDQRAYSLIHKRLTHHVMGWDFQSGSQTTLALYVQYGISYLRELDAEMERIMTTEEEVQLPDGNVIRFRRSPSDNNWIN